MKKTFVLDLSLLWCLAAASVVGGLILNEMRAKPLSLVYASPPARFAPSAATGGASSSAELIRDDDVSRDEMKQLVSDRSAVVLDARPEIFYRIGHIPSALSFPRDDFDAQYPRLKSTLENGRPIVVYCSGRDCHDSQLVADALRGLGLSHVRIFRGGWYDWSGADLPREKTP